MRPRCLVLVVGTGTDVGKTWVSARLLTGLRAAGVTLAARKPVQSFDVTDDPAGYDAAVLGQASGEPPEVVCPAHRWYAVAMAPPMAAESLGATPFSVADLVAEMAWPGDGVDVGLVETAGGVRSPQANDGDAVALGAALAPDVVVLVADAGLGTINTVRLTVGVLPEIRTVVVLNRFDGSNELHGRNREWLSGRDGLHVVVMPGGEQELLTLIRGAADKTGPI